MPLILDAFPEKKAVIPFSSWQDTLSSWKKKGEIKITMV